MVGKFTAIVLAVLLICSFTIAKEKHEKNKAHKDHVLEDTINIDELDTEGFMMDAEHEGSGPDDPDAEGGDSEEGSASGPDIGSGYESTAEPKTTTTISTRAPILTACQQLRRSTQFKDSYKPRCTSAGGFEKLQCQRNEECWCVSQDGKVIEGTNKFGEMDKKMYQPDCEGGSNLTPCVYLKVKSEWERLLGAFTPRCTDTGEFHKEQCRDNMCWCVDIHGRKLSGTEAMTPNRPQCEPTTTAQPEPTKAYYHPHEKTKSNQPMEMTTKGNNINNMHGGEKDGDSSQEEDEEGTNMIGKEAESRGDPDTAPTIMGQPGILAGIIGGAVVGLLCAILLVMFIVYRMRKKDEGSYALDEPTKARGAYAYQKAPDREFYA